MPASIQSSLRSVNTTSLQAVTPKKTSDKTADVAKTAAKQGQTNQIDPTLRKQVEPVQKTISADEARTIATQSAQHMFQAHGGLNADFVASLLDKNPNQSAST